MKEFLLTERKLTKAKLNCFSIENNANGRWNKNKFHFHLKFYKSTRAGIETKIARNVLQLPLIHVYPIPFQYCYWDVVSRLMSPDE